MKKINSSWKWQLYTKKLYSPFLVLLLLIGSSSSLLAQYCASNATSSGDSKLGEVAVNGAVIPAVLTCATYTDNTALTPFSINYGVPAASSFSYASCGWNYTSYAKVYIDFNQDQVFDASEVVRQGNCSAGSPLVGNLSLPTSGTLGLTRMRVVLSEGGSATSTVACGTYSYGETQDFTVNMRAAPSCLPPSAISASIASPTSVLLSWSANSGATGGYEYQLVAAGSGTPASGTATADTFATVSGLTIGSYDVYARSICGASPSAIWMQSSVLLDYCVSSATSTDDSKVGDIIIGNDTLINSTACATYTDLRGAPLFNLQFGIPSNVSVAYGTCGGSYSAFAKVYIDFNNDLIFDEATEMISSGNVTAGSPLVSNLNMAATGIVGNHVMRIVMAEGGSNAGTLACGTYSWGETQDITVAISAAPACAPPAGNMVVSTFGNQATLGWASSTNNVEIEYDSTGFVPGSSPRVVVINDSSTTLTGLLPSASYQYYIRSLCGASDSSAWAGPFNFATTVSCPAPTNFGGSVGTTWAGIFWQSNGLNTDYIYILDSAGVTTTTGTIMNGVGDSLYVSGLYPNTAYTLYVANNCGADTSNWGGAVNFTTSCGNYTAPYFQNFNSIASGFTGTLDCWNLGSGSTITNVTWASKSGQTVSSNTGPSSGNGGSGVYIYLETSSSGDDTAYAVSPIINIDGLSNPEAAFVYHMYGASMGTLRVDVWNGSSWDLDVWSISGQQHTSTTAAWTPAAVSLVGYSGDIAIRFAGNRNGDWTGDMAIDDFSIASPSPCAVPSNLGSWANSESSATIYWTAGDTLATNWVVQYGLAGNANNSMLVSNDTLTLTGLGHSTLHDFLVGEICASGDTSWMVGPVQFQTWFAPNYLEDFNSGYTWSEGKGRIADSTFFSSTSSSWIGNAFNNDFVTNDLAARMNIFSTGRYEWMFSPTIVVPDNGTVYELSFDIGLTEYGSSTLEAIMGVDDTVMVVVSTDNGVTWSKSNVVYKVHQGNKPAGVLSWPVSIPLFGYSGNLKIGFYAESTVSNEDIDVFIDNVAITENCSLAPVSISGVNFVSSPAQYNVQFSTSAGDLFVLQTREVGTDTWFTPKSWTAALTSQNFIARLPGVDNEVRLGARVNGSFYYSCPVSFAADCKPMTVSAIQLVAPFCAGDSAVLKAIDAGGFKAKTYLWNTGETTRFIYGQQGQTYQVVVTDAAGCSDSASVTVSNVGSPYTPGNFALAKPNQVTFVGSWTAPSLGSGVTLIGYRMQYRQVNVGASWRQTALTTGTSSTVNFTGSCDPSANYEFAVFARVNDNGTVYNTPVTCTERRFYNGSGGCTTAKSDINTGSASLNGIMVYPNPTNSMLNVGINGETSTLQLLDMNGKVLFNQEFVGQVEANINMSEFASGVYMLNITNATGVYQERVIKN